MLNLIINPNSAWKKTKVTLGFMLIMLLALSTGLMAQTSTPPSNYATSTGLSGDPYFISSIDNLYWLSQTSGDWDKYYEQTTNIDASTTSGWGGGAGFTPIGNGTTNFSGNYDGQGYTISDLYINRSGSNYLGLFGYINGATITEVGVVDLDYNSGTGDNIGSLVGFSDGSTAISKCYATGTISGDRYTGGLIGCINSGTIVSNCYTRTNITSCSYYSGGFSGQNAGTISYCYCAGVVTPSGAAAAYIGGFNGRHTAGSITNSFYDDDITNPTYSNGGTAKTTEEMKNVATFTDESWSSGLSFPVWDFETNPNDDVANNDYWDIDLSETINNGYPFLSWENGGDISLPVELTSFTAETTSQGVLCQWTTESEIENIGFLLERKLEGTDWQEIVSYKTDNGLMGQGTTSSYTNYEYLDTFVEPNTTYEYRLADVDYNGVVTYHSVRTITVEQTPISSEIIEFTVLPAYPNPFNPSTTISYGLDTDSHVTITIADITGQLITTLVNTEQSQGWHTIIWNGTNKQGEQIPAGLYLCRIVSDNEVRTTKLMLLK